MTQNKGNAGKNYHTKKQRKEHTKKGTKTSRIPSILTFAVASGDLLKGGACWSLTLTKARAA